MQDFVFDDPKVAPSTPGQRDPDAFAKDIYIPTAEKPWRVSPTAKAQDFVFDADTEREAGLRNLRESVSGIDPRQAAQAMEIARRSGIDPAVAMTDPKLFKAELEKSADFQALKQAPATSSYLDSPETMAIGQNEISVLTKTERMMNALDKLGSRRSMAGLVPTGKYDPTSGYAKDDGVGHLHALGGMLQEGLKSLTRGIASYGYEGGLKLQRESRSALEGLGYTPEQVTGYLDRNEALPKMGQFSGALPWWLRTAAYRPEQGDKPLGADTEVDILNSWGLPRIIYSLGKQLEKDNKVDLDHTTFTGSLLKSDEAFAQKVAASGWSVKLAGDVGQGISSMASTLIFGLMGMPVVGLGTMAMQIAGGDMERARAEGADPDVAWRAGNWNAVLQTPMEALSLAKAMKVWKPQGLLGVRFKDVFTSMITEGVTEAAQSVPEKLSELYIKSNARDITEVRGFMENVFTMAFLKEAAYSGAVGALTAGIIGGPKLLHSAIFNRNRENAAHDPVNALSAQIELLDATKSSDTALSAFTQQLIDSGKLPDKIFVPAREVAALFQDEALPDKLENVLGKLGITPEEFGDVLSRDGDLHIQGSRLGPILADADAKLTAPHLLLNPVEREAAGRIEEIAQQMQAEGLDIVSATENTMDRAQSERLFSTPLVENSMFRETLKSQLIAAKYPAHKAEQIAALVDANAQIWAAIPGESVESYYGKFGYKIQKTNLGKMLLTVFEKHGKEMGVASEGEFMTRYGQDQGFRDTVHQILEFPAEDVQQAALADLQVKHVKNPLTLGVVNDITLPGELQQAALAVTGNHENLQAIAGQGVDVIRSTLLGLGYDGIKYTGPDGVERMVALRPAPATRTTRDVTFQGGEVAQATHEIVSQPTPATGFHEVLTTLGTGRRISLQIDQGSLESVDVAEALKRGIISQEQAALFDGLLKAFPDTYGKHFEIRFADGQLTDAEGNIITSAYAVHKAGPTLEDAKHVVTLFEKGNPVEAIEAFGRFVQARALSTADTKIAKAEFDAYRKATTARIAEIVETLKAEAKANGENPNRDDFKASAIMIAASEGLHQFDKNTEFQAWFGRQFSDWWLRGTAVQPKGGIMEAIGGIFQGKTSVALEKIFRKMLAAMKSMGERLFGTTSLSGDMEMLLNDIVTTGRDINEKHFFSDADFAAKYILGVNANEQQVHEQGFSKNSKTGYSYDPGNLCPKKDNFTIYILEQMEKQGLTVTQLINTDLIGRLYNQALLEGIEVPCSYCYVEEARLKAIAFQQAGKPISTVRFAMAKETVRAVPYVDWILKASQEKIDFMNQRGGLRLFSFSDYIRDAHYQQIKLLLEHAQQRGLSVKAITKRPEFVRDFASTGININVSIDALDVGFGMDWKTAAMLAEMYPNVHVRTMARNVAEVDRYNKLRYRVVGGEVEFLDAYTTHSPGPTHDQNNLPFMQHLAHYQQRLAEGGWQRLVQVITPYHHDSPEAIAPHFQDMSHKYPPLVEFYRENRDALEHSCCQAGGKCFSEKLNKQCVGNCGLGAGQTSVPNAAGLPSTPQQGSLLQGGDVALKTDTPEFKAWSGGAPIIKAGEEYSGGPVVVEAAHGTSAAEDFEKFKRRPGDIGIHFGTPGQANDRLDYVGAIRAAAGTQVEGQRLIPVYLKFRNLLRLTDAGSWNMDNLDYQLYALFPNDHAAIRQLKTPKDIREFLQRKGYDGIVYKNDGEVEGAHPLQQAQDAAMARVQEAMVAKYGKARNSFSVEDKLTPEYQDYKAAYDAQKAFREQNAADSYIVFDPTQIKSVFNSGAFDPKDPRILYQGGDVALKTDTPEFRAWFGDSKVVDAQGKPLVVYHGREAVLEKDPTIASRVDELRKKGNDIIRQLLDKHGLDESGSRWGEAWNADPLAREHNAVMDELHSIVRGEWRSTQTDLEGGAFDPLRTKDLGVHFGVSGAANIFAKKTGAVFPVYLSAQNVVDIPNIFVFGKSRVEAVKDLVSVGVLTKNVAQAEKLAKRFDAIFESLEDQRDIADNPVYKKFWEAIEKGRNPSVDGLRYPMLQSEGGGDGYVVFDPTQIKSVFNRGTWSRTDARILFQEPVTLADAKALQWQRLGVMPWLTEHEVAQAIGSEDTSQKQVAATFSSKGIKWEPGSTNLDLGGGKYDLGTEALALLGVRNLVYDPFNRSLAHNESVARELAGQAPDTVTVNNVLNVIAEPEARATVIQQAAEALRAGGHAYVLIHEGDRSGQGRPTTRGFQNNLKAEAYIDEIKARFNTVRRSGNLIVASNPVQSLHEKVLYQGAELAPAFYSRLQIWMEQKLPDTQPASNLLRNIESWEKKAPGFSPSNVLAEDKKTVVNVIPGPLAEELRWSDIKSWLESKGSAQVTRDEVLKYLRENRVDIEVVELPDAPGGISDGDLRIREDARSGSFYVINNDGDVVKSGFESEEDALDYIDEIVAEQSTGDVAQYGPAAVAQGSSPPGLFTPGGKNYREMLFTLPERRITELPAGYTVSPVAADLHSGTKAGFRVFGKDGMALGFNTARADGNFATSEAAVAGALESLNKGAVFAKNRGSYVAGHYGTVAPNVLAHIRVQDFIHPTLGKVLLVEEVQSDWAAAGKKEGFKGGPMSFEIVPMPSSSGYVMVREVGSNAEKAGDPGYYGAFSTPESAEEHKANLEAGKVKAKIGIPAAPFVMTGQWMKHVTRQIMREAASGGYGAVAWTTGEMQRDRYNLGKHIERIDYEPVYADDGRTITGYDFSAVDKGGIEVIAEEDISLERIAEIAGKDIAEKVSAGFGEPAATDGYRDIKTIQGEGLKIGGESKLNLYDKQLPNLFRDVGKPWGIKLEPIELQSAYVGKMAGRASGWYMGVHYENVIVDGRQTGETTETFNVRDADGNSLYGPTMNRAEAAAWMETNDPVNKPTMHGFQVTSSMRQDILTTGQPLFQGSSMPKGATLFAQEHEAIIHFFEGADITTAGHEIYHVFRRVLQAMGQHEAAPQWMKDDWAKACEFVGARVGDQWTKAQEEKFAQAGETYLAEGRAPSVELRGVFAQFRTWILNIYKSIMTMPVRMTDEMRGVFDRMLATEQQIGEAAAKMDTAPLFDEEQLLDEDRVAYVKAAREAKLASEDEVMRKLDAQRKKLMPGWKKEAEAAAAGDPGQMLAADIIAEGGLNIFELRDAGMAESDIERLRKVRPGGHLLTEQEGVNAVKLSETYGFHSVTEMVAALIRQPSRAAIYEAKLAEIEAEWRDSYDPEVQVLSDRYEDLLDREAQILAKQTKGKAITGEAIRAMVNKLTGVTSLERISTSDIENLKSALRREAAAARRAWKAGKTEEAIAAKDRQRRALAELKAKYEAKIEVAKINQQVKKLLKLQGIRGEYFDQMVFLMNRLGMTTRQPSNPNLPSMEQFLATTHSAFDAEHNVGADGQPLVSADVIMAKWIIDDQIPATKDMTLDQLRAAHQSLAWLAHTGRTMGKLISKGKLIDAREVATEFKGNVAGMKKVHRMSDREKKTFFGRITSLRRGFLADLSMMEFLVKQADGFKKGMASITGTLRDVLIQPLIEARSAEKRAWEGLQERLSKIVVEFSKDRFAIDEVKLPEDVRQAWEGLWDMEKVFMVYLNMGNPGNLKALTRGYAYLNEKGELTEWTKADLDAIIKHMTPEMRRSAEEIWKLVDSVYPMVAATRLRESGVTLKKVQAVPFVNAHGETVRGGYYPLIFDGQFSRKAARAEERDIMNSREAVFQSPDPRSGMTVERKGGTLPPKLQLSTLYKHLWDSVHYATHAEACRDAWTLINDDVFRTTWIDTFGQESYDALTPWVRYIARPEREHADQFDSFLDKLRTKSTIVVLGLNLRSAVTQVNSILNTMAEVGVGNTLKGVGYMLSHRSAAYDQIDSWSTFMKHRSETMDADMKRVLMQRMPDGKYLKTPWGKVDMHDFHEFCFWSLKAVDGAMARVSWMAAYEKGMAELNAKGGLDAQEAHAQAVQYADDVARQTQGSSDPMDMANWMRSDSGWKKMFGMFMTFTMRFANRQGYYIRGLREGKISGAEFGKHFFLEWIMPPILSDIILAALVSGDVPDWEEHPGELAADVFGNFLSGIPVLRNVFGAVKFAGNKLTKTPALQGLDSATEFSYKTVTGIHDVLNGDLSDKEFRRWARSFVETVGYGVGIPYNWAFTAWDGVNDWIEGDTSNPLRLVLKDPTRPRQKH